MKDVPTITAYQIMDVISMIETKVAEVGDQKSLAKSWGISEQYLSDVLRGRREPGPTILKRMGLRKMVFYRKE